MAGLQRLFQSSKQVPENNRFPTQTKGFLNPARVFVNSSWKSTQDETDLTYPQGERLRARSPTVGARKFFLTAESLEREESRTSRSGRDQSGSCRRAASAGGDRGGCHRNGAHGTRGRGRQIAARKRGDTRPRSSFTKHSETRRGRQASGTFVRRPPNATCGGPLGPGRDKQPLTGPAHRPGGEALCAIRKRQVQFLDAILRAFFEAFLILQKY